MKTKKTIEIKALKVTDKEIWEHLTIKWEDENRRKPTIKNYGYCWDYFLKFYTDEVQMIDDETIKDYKKFLLSRMKEVSANSYLRNLKAMMNDLVELDLIQKAPKFTINATVQEIKTLYTEQEIMKLLVPPKKSRFILSANWIKRIFMLIVSFHLKGQV